MTHVIPRGPSLFSPLRTLSYPTVANAGIPSKCDGSPCHFPYGDPPPTSAAVVQQLPLSQAMFSASAHIFNNFLLRICNFAVSYSSSRIISPAPSLAYPVVLLGPRSCKVVVDGKLPNICLKIAFELPDRVRACTCSSNFQLRRLGNNGDEVAQNIACLALLRNIAHPLHACKVT